MQYLWIIGISLIYSIILNIFYFTKKHIDSLETKYYSLLIITNLYGLILELTCSIIGYKAPINSILSHIFTKVFMCSLTIFAFLMMMYIFSLSIKKRESFNKIKNSFILFLIISMIFILILPIQTFNGYAAGMSANLVYLLGILFIIIASIVLIKNRKTIEIKKMIPFISFIILNVIVSLIQQKNPQITITTSMECIVLFIMYYTIENPDLKMLKELTKNKELIMQNFEEKSNLIFEIKEGLKRPIDLMRKDLNNIDINNINLSQTEKNNLLDINMKSKEIYFIVNKIFDTSDLNTNIEISNHNYSLKLIIEEISIKYKNIIFNNYKSIPDYFYGDGIRIKQVLESIINYSINEKKSTSLEININYINKYEMCRLIIDIKDNGKLISLYELNDILNNNTNYENNEKNEFIDIKNIYNIILKMNGSFVINNDIDYGNNYLIIIDQKIKNFQINKIEQYSDKKRIALVDDKANSIKKIKRLLGKYEVITFMDGNDLLNSLKHNEKYNLILLDDDMKNISGLNTFEKIKKDIKNKMPIMILLENNKKFISDKYLELGFDNFILKSNIEQEIDKIDNLLN